jgi:hypothetical protein
MARRKWTKDRIIDKLRELESEGKLRPGYLTVRHGGLYSAGVKLFGSSLAMYGAAGIDPIRLGVRRKSNWKWTNDSITSELKRLRSIGEDIRPRALHKKHSGILDAGERIFGSSRKMYQAAGIDPADLGMLLDWSKEKVAFEIKKREESGESLNYSIVMRLDRKLAAAAKRHFGDWYAALAVLSIDPSAHRTKRPNRYWSKDRILDEIRMRQKSGEDMSQPAVRKDAPFLMAAATQKYGSWYAALEVAGISSMKHRKLKPMGYWTKEKIIHEIQSMHKQGLSFQQGAARKETGPLEAAAQKMFGSWYAAVEAAGFNVEGIRKFRPVGYWSRDEVTKEIFRLRKLNEDLSLVSIREIDGALYNGARRAFGSWKTAVESAGFDYREIRKDMMQEAFEGTVFEVYVKQALGILGWNVEYHKHFGSGNELCVPDFFDRNTKTWIDAKLNCSGHGVHSRISKYLQHTPRVKIIYLKGRIQKWNDSSVQFVSVRRLYPRLRERGAYELIENMELLRHGVTEPELQSRIVDFVARVSPDSVTMVRTQLEKVQRL